MSQLHGHEEQQD
jgi:hypothetical protein